MLSSQELSIPDNTESTDMAEFTTFTCTTKTEVGGTQGLIFTASAPDPSSNQMYTMSLSRGIFLDAVEFMQYKTGNEFKLQAFPVVQVMADQAGEISHVAALKVALCAEGTLRIAEWESKLADALTMYNGPFDKIVSDLGDEDLSKRIAALERWSEHAAHAVSGNFHEELKKLPGLEAITSRDSAHDEDWKDGRNPIKELDMFASLYGTGNTQACAYLLADPIITISPSFEGQSEPTKATKARLEVIPYVVVKHEGGQWVATPHRSLESHGRVPDKIHIRMKAALLDGCPTSVDVDAWKSSNAIAIQAILKDDYLRAKTQCEVALRPAQSGEGDQTDDDASEECCFACPSCSVA